MVKRKKPMGKGMLVVIALLAVIIGAGGVYMIMGNAPTRQTVTGDADTTIVSGVCPNVASISALYNDFNYYKAGTDPASTLTIYDKGGEEFKQTVADDATDTTVSAIGSFKAVAGTNAGTPSSGYFSELIEFSSACQDENIQPKLKPSGVPTLTLINDDGITKNSDSNHEAMGASSTYLPTMVIKAGSESCASRHGAYLIADYDATYFSKVSSSDLKNGNSIVLFAHNSTGNLNAGTNDQFKVFLYEGELCDGNKVEPQFKVETTATEPTEDVSVDFHWIARDIDVDADEYTPLDPAIYDEDNNLIGEAIVNATFYGA
jgi:hypothetical protein